MAASAPSNHRTRTRGVSWRAVVIALILIPLNSYWIVMMEVIRYSGHPTTISLFFNAVFTLVVILLVNAALARVAPRWALSAGEILTVYVMVALASAMSGHDMIQILVSLMGHPVQFPDSQTPLFAHYLPRWLTMRNARALDDFYSGHSTLYTLPHLRAWAPPVLAWMAFISALLLVMLCINAVVRRQWTRSERLTYPIVQLPIAMADPQARLFRSRMLWAGIAVAGAIDLLNGLAYLFPTLPHIQVRATDLQPLMPNPPWNAMYGFLITFYPFVIGMGMLLPVDLLFSCWFFFLFWKAQMVINAALGFNAAVGSPWTNEQAFGGYIGIVVAILWTERNYFRAVLRKAIRGDAPDAGEPISYRSALLGVGIGFLGLAGFLTAAGMSAWLAVAFLALYLVFSLSVTRMRAELGPPAHDLHYTGPDQMLVRGIGSENLSPQSLGVLSMTWWFNRSYRSHPMPVQLEAFKIAERAGVDTRRMFWAILAAGVIGSLAAFWALLDSIYRFGPGFSAVRPALIFGTEPYLHLGEWLTQPKGPNLPVIGAAGAGLGTVIGLQMVRARFPGFPFHPLGYAVSTSWAMNYLWMPLLIAWVVKLLLLRYGGLRLYQRALPFFFGLILGEFIVGSLWTLFGIAFNIPTYGFWV